MQRTSTNKPSKTLKLTMTGLLIALVFIVTAILPRVPYGLGYVNLGDAMVLFGGFFLGPIGGFVAGGFGSALADWYLGYNQYILFSLFVKGLEGLAAGYLLRKFDIKFTPLFLVISVSIMPLGYFVSEWLILPFIDKQYGVVVAITSLPGNAIQAIAGVLLALPLIYGLKKYKM